MNGYAIRGKQFGVLPNFQLLKAIKSNCLLDFNEAIRRGATFKARDHDDRTALEVTLRHDRPELARRLIDDGADPNQRIGKRGNQLIHLAAETGDIGFMAVLLDEGVNPNSAGHHRRTALHIATKKGFEYLGRTLLDHGANPDASDAQGNTSLHVAASRGSTSMTQLLISFNANASSTNNQLYTPIHDAAANGHTEIARKLLDRERSVNPHFDASGILGRVQRVAELHNQSTTAAALGSLKRPGAY